MFCCAGRYYVLCICEISTTCTVGSKVSGAVGISENPGGGEGASGIVMW